MERHFTDKELQDMKHKLDRIYTTMVGDEDMGVKGLAERISELEDEAKNQRKFRDRILIGATVVGVTAGFLYDIGEKVIEFFSHK